MPIVMLYDDIPQYVLSDIQRGKTGSIKRAWVVNGGWTLLIKGEEHQAKDGLRIVNRWPAPSKVSEVEIKGGKDYNDILQRAFPK